MGIWDSLRRFAAKREDKRRQGTKRKTSGRKSRVTKPRDLRMEQFEARVLLAISPDLVGIYPSGSERPLDDGEVLHVAPRELKLQFQEGEVLNAATLAAGITIVRSGGDGLFSTDPLNPFATNPITNPLVDQQIVPGWMGIGDNPNEVLVRFAETLPDDVYQFRISDTLLNTSGDKAVPETRTLTLDLGTQITAVVPQPITRTAGVLSQTKNEIVVYFDHDAMNTGSVQNPAFYRLVNTSTGSITLPLSVTFVSAENGPAPASNDPAVSYATLTFAEDFATGTYRLEIGTSDEANGTTASATRLGTLAANLGDANLTRVLGDGAAIQAEVDLYSFSVKSAGTVAVDLDSLDTLNGTVRLFNSLGGVVLPSYTDGSTGVGGTAHFEFPVAAGQTYYVGVSGSGNTGYNPVDGTGAVPGGSVGSYTLNVAFGGSVLLDDINDSTFELANDLGGLGAAEKTISGVSISNGVAVVLPGGSDTYEIGHRHIPVPDQGHLMGGPSGYAVKTYDFRLNIGGGYINQITETQKQRAREILQIYASLSGYEFREVSSGGSFFIATGDIRAMEPTIPPLAAGGIAGGGGAIMNVGLNWGASEYGGSWFSVAFHELGHVLGLGHTYDLPPFTVMGSSEDAAYTGGAEVVWPGDADVIHLQYVSPPSSNDIDLYKFQVEQVGWFTAETVAERLTNSSSLNTKLTLYRQNTDGSREVIATNDDYFSNDSFIGLQLSAGTYFIAVTSTGLTDMDPTIADTGFGGTTAGLYELHLNLKPLPASTILDTTGTELDGDSDGQPGGTFNFWFKVQDSTPDPLTNKTIIVDKAAPSAGADGTMAHPYNQIDKAFIAAKNPALGGGVIVRVVANGGADGNVATIADNLPYLVGLNNSGAKLEDCNELPGGERLQVPQGVTMMIDAGVLIKMRKGNIEAGSSDVGIDLSGGAIQVLGTPLESVHFRSFRDDSVGGNSDGVGPGAARGDYGGLVFREDSDREEDGVFLNWVNHAEFQHGGGKVYVNSVEETFNPVHMAGARPTVSFNTILNSLDAAISADLASFEDSSSVLDWATIPSAWGIERVGPDVHGNRLVSGALTNTINGLRVRVKVDVDTGLPLESIDAAARWDDTDIVHFVTQSIQITGTPGGPLNNVARLDGRLAVDPGVVVKLGGARIDVGLGAQLLAEGTATAPVIFTSIHDDRYGAGGTYDTNDNNAATAPTAGSWSGIVFRATSSGSFDHAEIAYAGGLSPITPSSDRFNAVEIHQAEVRIVNSSIHHNASGAASTNRDGLGGNRAATIYVAGAQPIIVNNRIYDNAGDVISINANAMQATVRLDTGRSTGLSDAYAFRNSGPLVRMNRMENTTSATSQVNGIAIRGATLTTESVWDDTDIAHILRDEIVIPNFHTYGGLRLVSNADAGLVIKLGSGAGFTATGAEADVDDRVGGSLYILGEPDRPVTFTSLNDDTIAAGVDLDGYPLYDTNGDGASAASPGDWRSIKIDELANTRNVGIFMERESATTGGADINATPGDAQFLGTLAPDPTRVVTDNGIDDDEIIDDEKAGDDNQQLGFQVNGVIAVDDPTDVDVYSFFAKAGTEVWIDIDRTGYGLDAVVELVRADGEIFAYSINNTTLQGYLSVTPQNLTDPDPTQTWVGGDRYTSNSRDAGMRVVLPGTAGVTSLYYVRVRSNTVAGDIANVDGGLTSGQYQLQIRLRQLDEIPGSAIRYADIRYATNGIEVYGQPTHSPLTGESYEAYTNGGADVFNSWGAGGSQPLGNILLSDRNVISVGGNMATSTDVDWYTFTVDYDKIQVIGGFSDGAKSFPLVFDIDYADGLTRADTVLAVYDSTGHLILVSRDSDVDDDQPATGQGVDMDDLTRGSARNLDPFIGTVQVPAGVIALNNHQTYYVAVASNFQTPSAIDAVLYGTDSTAATRLEPVNSIQRVAEDHIGFNGYTTGYAGTGEIATVMPETASLFDISSSFALQTHIRPYTLQDVALYVSTTTPDYGHLYTVNPFTGATVSDVGNLSGTNYGYGDIAMRADGTLWGQTRGTNNSNSGNLRQIDTGTAAQTNVGDDGLGTNPDVGGQWDAITFRQYGSPGQYTTWAVNNRDADDNNNAGDGLGYPRGLYRINSSGGAIDENSATGFQRAGSLPADTITGLAFASPTSNVLFAVSSTGNLWRTTVSDPGASIGAGISGWTQVATDVTGTGAGFTGLALGPQNLDVLNSADDDHDGMPDEVEDGIRQLSSLFFATGSDRRLYAFDATGTLQTVFDRNGDGRAESTSSNASLPANTTGLAFTCFDFNLWHPTMARKNDAGHGVADTFDNTRSNGDAPYPVNINYRPSSEGSGGASFYFGIEEWVASPFNTGTNDCYYPYDPDGSSYADPLTFNYVNAQYGIASENIHRNIVSSASIGDTDGTGPEKGNYNVPGGAMGSLVTSSFSLQSSTGDQIDPQDKPTLYFNYFLETENVNAARSSGEMNDAARVWISKDNGYHWTLLATNNSTLSGTLPDTDNELPRFKSTSALVPGAHGQQRVQELYDNTGVWRQARVDLSEFAGEADLILRFDFTTAGRMTQATPVDTSISGFSIDASGSLGDSDRYQRNDYEGFYIDDIIIGYADRGEMVTNAPVNTSFRSVPQNPMPDAEKEVFTGAYQLEVRRGTEYASAPSKIRRYMTIYNQFDTNTRFIQENGLLGDRNVIRQQDHLQIYGNTITDVSQWGIYVDSTARDATDNLPSPGSVRNLPTLNNNRLVPGVSIVNNIVDSARTGGIFFSGDPNTGNTADAAVPFGRILNNTIYGGATATGIGIRVTDYAGPTILNNIIANTATGISIDATSTAQTAVDYNLFKGNGTPGTLGTNYRNLTLPSDPLFMDPLNGNFYLAPNSQAIDSSQSFLNDRSDLVEVKASVGIPASAIKAPASDRYNQKRADALDPNTGDGPFPYYDRGAVERIDVDKPYAKLVKPLDNGPADRHNVQDDDYVITFLDLNAFHIQLYDVGVGIWDPTVVASCVSIQRDGLTLTEGSGGDYIFTYDAVNDRIILTPTAGLWEVGYTYTITLTNAIQDMAGNSLTANRPNGTTVFIVVLPGLDFGDAPDSVAGATADYDTLLVHDGARHGVLWAQAFYLGANVSPERDAKTNAYATADSYDDGVVLTKATFTLPTEGVPVTVNINSSVGTPPLLKNATMTFQVTAVIPSGTTAYLDAWIDWDHSGTWETDPDPLINEKILVGGARPVLTNGVNEITVDVPAGATLGEVFGRFRLSSSTVRLDPTGVASDGEVEDYRFIVVDSLSDFGDAPDNISGAPDYATLAESHGPAHQVNPATTTMLMLGQAWDAESDGRPYYDTNPNPSATFQHGDSSDRKQGVSGDGVLFNTSEYPVAVGNQVRMAVTVSTAHSDAGAIYLNAWLDANVDGTFGNFASGEHLDLWLDSGLHSVNGQLAISRADAIDGVVTTTAGLDTWTSYVYFQVPDEVAGQPVLQPLEPYKISFMRFRLSHNDVNGAAEDLPTNPTGLAVPDGEVEDYQVAIVQTPCDYGDAPDSNATTANPFPVDYQTFLADTLGYYGARNRVDNVTRLRLGATITADADGQPYYDAAATDPNTTHGDSSDDGVQFIADPVYGYSLVQGEIACVKVTVNGSVDGYLSAWLDWNADPADAGFVASDRVSMWYADASTYSALTTEYEKLAAARKDLYLANSGFTSGSLDELQLGAGEYYVCFQVPYGGLDVQDQSMTTFLRFRLNDRPGVAAPDGPDPNTVTGSDIPAGEIEDYQVRIVQPLRDFGDAPNSTTTINGVAYPTTLSDNGPVHRQDPDLANDGQYSLKLGSAWNAETDGQPGAGADLDTSDDGWTNYLTTNTFEQGERATIQLEVTAASGVNTYLNAWLDYWMADGAFNEATEHLLLSATGAGVVGVSGTGEVTLNFATSGAHTITVSFDVPYGVLGASNTLATYMRFRLSHESGLEASDVNRPTATTRPADGEVEDYRVTIGQPQRDFGDAPDRTTGVTTNYTTLLRDNGAVHRDDKRWQLTMGTLTGTTRDWTAEGDGQPTAAADGDTGDNGVVFESPYTDIISVTPLLAQGETASMLVTISWDSLDDTTTSVPVYLNAWLDLDGDGFEETTGPSGEHLTLTWDDTYGTTGYYDDVQSVTTDPTTGALVVTYDPGVTASSLVFRVTFDVQYGVLASSTSASRTTYMRMRLSHDGADGGTASLSSGPNPVSIQPPDGEVEDYQVQIIQPLRDFGDAPDHTSGVTTNYATVIAGKTDPLTQGANHRYDTEYGLRLGSNWDSELDGQPTIWADGDDLHGADGSTSGVANDEDGVRFDLNNYPMTPGSTVMIEVTASWTEPSVGAAPDAYLNMWIDWHPANQAGGDKSGFDGVFNGVPEHVELWTTDAAGNNPSKPSTSLVVHQGVNYVWFTIPDGILDLGEDSLNTYMRVRLSHDPNLGNDAVTGPRPYGPGLNVRPPDGEVEDYRISIVAAPQDFGDAPDGLIGYPSYPTLLDNNGARHSKSNLYLGSNWGYTTEGQPDPHDLIESTNDRNYTGHGDSNDDGVILYTDSQWNVIDPDNPTLRQAWTPGTQAHIIVHVPQGAGGGYLKTWVDWNYDGDWTDTSTSTVGNELVTVTKWASPTSGVPLSSGTAIVLSEGDNYLTIDVPPDLGSRDTFVRFRYSDRNDLESYGVVDAGGGVVIVPAGEVEDYRVHIESGDASISGTVFNDLNGNGIWDKDANDYYALSAVVPSSTSTTITQLTRTNNATSQMYDFGFNFVFYGRTYTHFWVNTNGVVSLDGPSYYFNSSGLSSASQALIAPFWADVDTSALASGDIRMSRGTAASGNLYVQIDWVSVGYYRQHNDKTNSFTLYIEHDQGGDIVAFIYRDMGWTTGDANLGVNGFGGAGADIGFSGTSASDFFRIARPASAAGLSQLQSQYVFRFDPRTGRPAGIEPGWEGARVWVEPAATSDGVWNPLTEPMQVTGPDGAYSFDNLYPGTYYIYQEVPSDVTDWTQSYPTDILQSVPGNWSLAGSGLEGRVFTLTDYKGLSVNFEFDYDGSLKNPSNQAVRYRSATAYYTAVEVAVQIASAVNSVNVSRGLNITATAIGDVVVLGGKGMSYSRGTTPLTETIVGGKLVYRVVVDQSGQQLIDANIGNFYTPQIEVLPDATVLETNSGTTKADVKLGLTNSFGGTLSVYYQTADGTASSSTGALYGQDYRPANTSVTLAQFCKPADSWDNTVLTQSTLGNYKFSVTDRYVVWEAYDGYHWQIYINDTEYINADGTANPDFTVALTSDGVDHRSPVINGNTVSWSAYDPVRGKMEIYVCQLRQETITTTTGQTVTRLAVDLASRTNGGNIHQLTTSDLYDSTDPQLSDQLVAWIYNKQVYVYDLSRLGESGYTGTKVSTAGINSDLDVSGNKMVWAGTDGTAYDIYYYDLATHITTRIHRNAVGAKVPQIDADAGRIVWQAYNASTSRYNIYVYDIATDTTLPAITASYGYENDKNPQVSGDYVVWTGYDQSTGTWQIYYADLSAASVVPTNLSKTIVSTDASRPIYSEYAQITGTRVVWQMSDAGNWEVYYADLSDPNYIPVNASSSSLSDWWPQVTTEGTLVWKTYDGTNYQIVKGVPETPTVTVTLNVLVNGDAYVELDEQFYVTVTDVRLANQSVIGAFDTDTATATVNILNDDGKMDYGDAPASYGTLLADNGARHRTNGVVWFGTNSTDVDSESNGQPNSTATGDDVAVSDDEASATLSALVRGQPSRATVQVGNLIEIGTAYINAWIDFNGDGDWADYGEQVYHNYQVYYNASTNTYVLPDFLVPGNAAAGNTYARFRVTANTIETYIGSELPGYLGTALDGEVEDYQYTIIATPEDYGDAPGTYPTLPSNSGARHQVVAGFHLGAVVTFDNGLTSASLNSTATSDVGDDGVTINGLLIPGRTGNITVTGVDLADPAAAHRYVTMWIDYNKDGDWKDSGELVYTLDITSSDVNQITGAFTKSFDITVPSSALMGATFARFRYSHSLALVQTSFGPAAGTDAPDGEVEDYQITISPIPEDWGDAPDGISGLPSYATLSAHNGAHHQILDSNFRLGATVTAELDGQPNATATGDSSDDGVVFNTAIQPGAVVSMTVTANTSGGYLSAWIDWNRDGDWTDANEQLTLSNATNGKSGTSVLLAAGANGLTFTAPSSLTTLTSTMVRFRYSHTSGLAPVGPSTGAVPDGEVEDYAVPVIGNDASISGSVFVDLNANGQWEPSGSAGAEVGQSGTTVYLDLNNDQACDPNEPTRVTGADGSYSFTGLMPGTYTVRQVIPSGWAQTRPTAGSYTVTLAMAPNQAVTGVNFGNYKSAHLTVSNATVQKPVSGTRQVTVTVSLAAKSGAPVSVDYWTADGTAKVAEGDYQAAGGTVTIPAGQTSTTITLVVNGNSDIEADQYFYLMLGSPVNAVLDNSQATITISNQLLDFGSAPAPYVTMLAENGPFHALATGFHLGATVVPETDGRSPDTSDNDGVRLYVQSDGTDITAPSSQHWVAASRATIKVNVQGAGNLSAWVDWDGDGAFGPSEQVFTDVPLNTGDTLLTIDVPATVITSTTYARFRYSHATGLDSVGLAANGSVPDGEVEDYALSLVGPAASVSGVVFNDADHDGIFDSGESGIGGRTVYLDLNNSGGFDLGETTAITAADGSYSFSTLAPGTYTIREIVPLGWTQTLPVSSGGITVDLAAGEATTAQNFGVYAVTYISVSDVSVSEGNSGPKQVVITLQLTGATTGSTVTAHYSTADGVTIPGSNKSGATGGSDYLTVPDTMVTFPAPVSGQTVVTTTVTLTVYGDTTVEADEFFYVNLSNPVNAALDTTQAAITILNDDGQMDYGDAPASYGTLLANNGARHIVGPATFYTAWNATHPSQQLNANLQLGSLRAAASDGAPSQYAKADANDDGITFLTPLVPGQMAKISVTTTAAGRLNGWIDYNRDGQWSDPGEALVFFADSNGSPGSAVYSGSVGLGTTILWFQVPPTATTITTTPDTFARFRISSLGGLSPTGTALDGEVEDYHVLVGPSFVLNGSTLTVVGTAGNDTFKFTAGTSYSVTVNSLTRTFDSAAISAIAFDGSSGTNLATLTGSSSGGERVELWPGSGTFTGADGVTVTVTNVARITAASGGGNDTVVFHDSTGADAVTASSTSASQVGIWNGITYTHTTTGFTTVEAYSTSGTDTANLYDTAGNDTFNAYVTPTRVATLTDSGSTYLLTANGFVNVTAYATKGGKDEAYLYDSTGNDMFQATPSYGKLYRTGVYSSQAKLFDKVYANASNGGTDQAFLYDSTRDGDIYEGQPTSAKLSGSGYENWAKYFDAVYGYSTGGADTAKLFGSTGADTFTGRPQYSVLTGPTTGGTYYHRVKGFKTVTASASAGNDVANLYDAATATQLDGSGSLASMYDKAMTFSYTVSGFKKVNAYATHAGNSRNVSAISYVMVYYGPW